MNKALDTDVLILGAGMAGLTAARSLAQRGLRVIVVEARERAGGRIFSEPVEGGGIVELGAEFVHGRAAELWSLLAEAGVEAVERDGTMLSEEWGGGLAEDDDEEDPFAALEALTGYAGEDMSFAAWLAQSDVREEDRAALLNFVEGFNAADAKRIGIRALGVQQKAEDEIEGMRAWHVRGGYAQLAEYLAARVKEAGVEIRLGTEVLALEWSAGDVCVKTSHGDLRAKQCIVTLPLGVLQRVNLGGISIQPEPQAIAQARRMEMGHALRFTMVWRERWWERSQAADKEALQQMSFFFTPQRMPRVWWVARPEIEPLPTLTGWVGGPKTKELDGKSAEELGEQACVELAEVFAIDTEVVRASLVKTYLHGWSSDPYSQGAYSYVPADALDAPSRMTEPELDTLYFAGEHTDVTGHWGTVHAAIRSGLRVAEQVLKNETA